MKISPSGAPILHGNGLDQVKRRIEEAFRAVRTDVRTNTNEPEIEIIQKAAPVIQRPQRPLAEKAAPILHAAVQGRKDTAIPHHNAVHRKAVHTISIPKKSAQELIAEALKVLGGKR
jgi:hypothetical protein